jgi:hypothetical protein
MSWEPICGRYCAFDPQFRSGADEMNLVNPGFPTVNYTRRMTLPVGYEKHEATVTLQFWHSRLAAITITWGAQAFRSTNDLESQGTMMVLTIIETYQGLVTDSGHGFGSAQDQQGNTVDVFTVTPNKPGAPVATPCVCLEYVWGPFAKALKDTQPKPKPSPY